MLQEICCKYKLQVQEAMKSVMHDCHGSDLVLLGSNNAAYRNMSSTEGIDSKYNLPPFVQ